MGDQIYKMMAGEEFPVEPAGGLLAGWMPGTWVRYSSEIPKFGGLASVDFSDGTGVLAGFLLTGNQHSQPVELVSDMWTTDTRQRPGGDTRADWGGADAGGAREMDENLQLQRAGSRIVTMIIPPTGFYRFYVYEVNNLAERTTAGTGSALVYNSGDLLYVSSQGLLTSEQESISHTWTGYVVGNTGEDDEGSFLFAVAAMV